MIYVLCSSGFDCENLDHTIKLIKIGFTNNWRKRLDQYKMHNPTIQILYKFDEGIEEDEKYLHQYFKNYRYSEYGNEWFRFDEYIINFFNTNNTIEKIREVLCSLHKFSELKKTDPSFNIYICSILKSAYTKTERMRNLDLEYDLKKEIKDMNIISTDELKIWAKNKYPNKFEEINKQFRVLMDLSKSLNKEVLEFLYKYERLPNIRSRLKFLCEYSSSKSEEFKSIIVCYISDNHFKEFFELLGLERCRALGYHVTKLKEDAEIASFDLTKLKNEIYKEFAVGNRYPLVDVKLKLSNIYKSCGYSKTPKATDLKEWFDVKVTKIFKDNKKPNCFKIIKKK